MTKIEFKVWKDGWNDKDSADAVFARDEEEAANAFIEENFSNRGFPTESEVFVMDPKGVITKWRVNVEQRPVFMATQIEVLI